ncbi:MAG: preprotein translocase subunit SecE [Propionibacteriales bacterium]|nr:preprotein translocase subunit SecE [Propionibacteriales bacterium]
MTETRSAASSRDGGGGRRTSPATFYRQVVAEMRKVVWPTRQQLITYFWVVLMFVLVMIAIVSALDYVLGRLMFRIFG